MRIICALSPHLALFLSSFNTVYLYEHLCFHPENEYIIENIIRLPSCLLWFHNLRKKMITKSTNTFYFSLFFILVNQSIITLRSIFHYSQIRTRFKPCSFHFIFTSYVGFHKEKQQNLIADNLLAPLTTTLLQPMIQEDTLRWTVFCLPRMRSSFHPWDQEPTTLHAQSSSRAF